MPRKVLVTGANSAIARETAKLLAADGDSLFLAGRDGAKLEAAAADLRVRGAAHVETAVVDLDRFEGHAALVDRAAETMGGLDTVLVAQGLLGDPARSQREFPEAEAILRTNFVGVVSLLTPIADRFEAQGSGTIVGISSVAGDRGRQSHYVYGAAKGALSLYLQGLRNRLFAHGVRVITVKPGFVDTPMTAHLEKGALFVSPEVVAAGIHRAIRKGRDVVYLPWFWWPIMTAIRLVPEALFKRLKL